MFFQDCRSSLLLLEDTLNHEKKQYFEQKRVTVALNNSEIVKRTAATAISDKMNNSNEEFTFLSGINPFLNRDSSKNSLQTYTLNNLNNKENESNFNNKKADIKLLLHIHEHSEKISQLIIFK